jgi:hypothetical protein
MAADGSNPERNPVGRQVVRVVGGHMGEHVVVEDPSGSRYAIHKLKE